MTKYNIRIYQDAKTPPSVFEDVDRYLMEKGIWLIVKWDEEGRTVFLNVSTVREINIEEVDDGDDYYDMLVQVAGNKQEGDNVE